MSNAHLYNQMYSKNMCTQSTHLGLLVSRQQWVERQNMKGLTGKMRTLWTFNLVTPSIRHLTTLEVSHIVQAVAV